MRISGGEPQCVGSGTLRSTGYHPRISPSHHPSSIFLFLQHPTTLGCTLPTFRARQVIFFNCLARPRRLVGQASHPETPLDNPRFSMPLPTNSTPNLHPRLGCCKHTCHFHRGPRCLCLLWDAMVSRMKCRNKRTSRFKGLNSRGYLVIFFVWS